MLTDGESDWERAMDMLYNLLTIGVPALVGLAGWVMLRQRNTPPLVAGCSAMAIALVTMTAIFMLMFII